ncbi:MAG: cation:proton antiporter [Dehalococcoidia bacterium]|nr:cation:proton antiporter [Dehalococcoidia bacterium]
MEHSIFIAIIVIGFSLALVDVFLKKTGLPVIIFYLAIGLFVGVSGINILNSEELGEIYYLLVELLVALIVFEGAFAIDIPSLKRVGRVIRNLISIGLLLTFIFSFSIVYFMDILEWQSALVFGSLVTVSGPTVIGPLIRRASLNDKIKTVLLGESILIDPVGAIFAIFVLEFVLSGLSPDPVFSMFSRIIIGGLIGVCASFILWCCLKISKNFSKDEVLLLFIGSAIATFSLAEVLSDGAGLMSVAFLGVSLAGMEVPTRDAVKNTQDLFVRIAIASVFILASAVVDLQVVTDLWPSGFIAIALIIFLIRPVVVFISTYSSSLSIREKLFISFVSPRGVVAAALAAFAGEKLGGDDGTIVVALVFLVIVITVVLQFAYASLLARLLGVESMKALISGQGPIAKKISDQLSSNGYVVSVILSNEDKDYFPHDTEKVKTIIGSPTDEKLIQSINLRDMEIVAGITNNDESNLLFIQLVKSIKSDIQSYALVNHLDSIKAFESSGIKAIRNVDATAGALLELMGNPTLHTAVSGGENRLVLEVQIGSVMNGKKVKDLSLPSGTLVILIYRKDDEVVPRGDTVLQNGDRLLLFGRSSNVNLARDMLLQLN